MEEQPIENDRSALKNRVQGGTSRLAEIYHKFGPRPCILLSSVPPGKLKSPAGVDRDLNTAASVTGPCMAIRHGLVK